MKSPSPPDPVATANAQMGQNIATATANSVIGNANETNPMGSVRYQQTGTVDVAGQPVPQFSRTVTLSPEQQRLYDQQTALSAQMNDIAGNQLTRLNDTLSSPIDTNSLPAMPDYDRQRYEDALFHRISPHLERDRAAVETQLANQGVRPGSEAYREAIALTDREQTDARMQAILNAGQYAGQEMSVAGTARDRALQEQLALRNQPINEIGALMSGGQVSMPQFSQYQGGHVAGAPLDQYINQNYQERAANHQAKMGGIFGLGGALLAAPMTGGGSLGGLLGSKLLGS